MKYLPSADVQKVDLSQRPFKVWVGEDENELHLAQTIVIATGARANYLGLDGDRFAAQVAFWQERRRRTRRGPLWGR